MSVFAIVIGVLSFMAGGTAGVYLGAALGVRRREALERTLAWYERVLRDSAAARPAAEPATVYRGIA